MEIKITKKEKAIATKMIGTSVSEKQYEEIEELSKKYNTTISSLLRDILLAGLLELKK